MKPAAGSPPAPTHPALADLAKVLAHEHRQCAGWTTDRTLANLRDLARHALKDAGLNTTKIDADIRGAL